MKKKFLSGVVMFMILITGCAGNSSTKNTSRVSFSGAFALYPLAVKWAEEYNKSHPGIRFDIQAGGAGKGMTDVLTGAVDVGLFSREITQEEKDRGVWWVALTKDAVIPTINSGNPFASLLKKRGLKREEFKAIFITQSVAQWSQLFPDNAKEQMNISVYTRSDACGAAGSWADYLGAKQENLKGIGIFGDPGLADAIIKDKGGIGYNNTNYIYDISSGKKREGIEVIPIDINGNGVIDSAENVYDDLNTLLKAVIDDRYPSPPARDLYFITKGKPASPEIIDFIRWVLTEGQKYVKECGYVPLPEKRIKEELSKISK